MSDIVERLRDTTEQMACTASVDMSLWDKHSNACLEAAAEIERLRKALDTAEENRETYKAMSLRETTENARLRALVLQLEDYNKAFSAEYRAENAKLRAALNTSILAIDDWLNVYASEFCDERRVKEAKDRIMQTGGAIAYISGVQEKNRAAAYRETGDE